MLRAHVRAFLALAAFAGSAIAHEGATGIVKARMDQMKAAGEAVKRINARLKQGRDLRAIAEDAELIRGAADRMPSLFPQGSGGGHSEAKSSVWERWPEFVEKARALEREAERLRTLAGTGRKAEVEHQFRSMNGACVACHDAFRAKQ